MWFCEVVNDVIVTGNSQKRYNVWRNDQMITSDHISAKKHIVGVSLILQNWISMRPVSSLTGNHLLPYQGVTMIQKIGNQDKVVTFDPSLIFNFEAKSFLISKCKYKWWNLHFSVGFLISYSFNWRCDQLTFLQTIDAR